MKSLTTVLIALLAGLVIWFAFDRLIDERNSAQFEAKGLREAARISGEMLADRDDIDRTRTEALNHALSKNADLQRDVADGRERLRVNATCSSPKSDHTSAGSVADAATAELAADARPDYFTLVDQLALSKKMILGLQDHALRVCPRQPQQTLNP